MLNSILKIILKIFNKKKYLEIKESEKNKKKLFFYNKNIKNRLEEIDSYLKKKKKIIFSAFWTLWRFNLFTFFNKRIIKKIRM